jgi:hypothetical protein
MTRRNRDIEIFTLSALDLFASAMGVFVLLSVMMLPFYFKGKDFETEIGELALSLAQSATKTAQAAAAVADVVARINSVDDLPAVDVTPEQQALRAEQQRQLSLARTKEDLSRQIEDLERELAAAQQPPEIEPDKVTFRFLGLKTNADRYLILVDGAKRIQERAENLPAILKKAISVFGASKSFAIVFYNNNGGRLNYIRWPETGFRAGGAESLQEADAFMRAQYDAMRGGSATVDALEKAVSEGADSIIFISDGFILPEFNKNLRWPAVVERVTRANSDRVEINTVAIGISYRRPEFWGFLNELRRANQGDLKMVPP